MDTETLAARDLSQSASLLPEATDELSSSPLCEVGCKFLPHSLADVVSDEYWGRDQGSYGFLKAPQMVFVHVEGGESQSRKHLEHRVPQFVGRRSC